MPCSRTISRQFTASGLREIRRIVAEKISDDGMRLAIHEVCLNAICHGGGAGWLAFDQCGGCQVWDFGPGIPPDYHQRVCASDEHGRGLLIARSLAAVTVASGPCGTLVTISPTEVR